MTSQNEDTARAETPVTESLESSKNVHNASDGLRPLASSFNLLLTSYALLASRLTGDEDIAIETNYEDNGQPFVLRLPVTPTETFSELATKVQSVSAA